MRELSHLTQTAIGPKTVGFEDIEKQALSRISQVNRDKEREF